MKTKIVGILNYTPDSFSDGNCFFDLKSAQKKIEEMLEDGADIVDIGATSTSYNQILLTAEEEWTRLKDLLNIVAKQHGKQISLDTFYPENAKKAIALGVHMINDVNGSKNKEMIDVISKNRHVLYVFMYSIVLPANKNIRALDTQEIYNFAKDRLINLRRYGIELSRVIFDPGIGFTTDPTLSLKIIANLSQFKNLQIPIYIGHSRKSFLESMTDSEPKNRDIETLAASLYMIMQKVDYLRVHNVKMHIKARKAWDVLLAQNS